MATQTGTQGDPRVKVMMKFFVIATILLLAFDAIAQKSTEMYIPIGKSPGLSEKQLTVIGQVEAAGKDLFVVSGVSVKVDGKTSFYLDKSKVKVENKYGKFEDVGVKKKVEVKFVDNDRKKTAEWVKIESP